MNVELINDHVLFGQDADWRTLPAWSRVWQTQIADAVTRKESRQSLRVVPRHRLTFLITPNNAAEQFAFDAQLMAAKKSGLACSPFWGRGCRISGVATGDTILCGRNWEWAAGDFVHVENSSGFEFSEVEAAVYNGGTGLWTLTLTDALTGQYNNYARPLLFGKFSAPEMKAFTPTLGPLRITITERINARTAQIGETPAPSTGNGEIFITM